MEETLQTEAVGLSKEKIVELRKQHLGASCCVFFRENPLMITRASGQYMYDEQGHRYLDCINNVAHVGHCHPEVVKAGADQMGMLSTNNRYLHENIVLLARRLAETFPAPLSVCYFVNSGTEANELAIRIARAHTKAKDIIVMDHAYHGTSTTLTDISPYKFNGKGGSGKQEWVHVVPTPDVYNGKWTDRNSPGEDLGTKYANEVKQTIDEAEKGGRKIAAFLAESLQSCGGQIIPPPRYLTQVYQHMRAAGSVCIADEVQVGFGRVGSHWWAFQLDDVVPDIVVIGKSMGNGFPVAAVVTTPQLSASFAVGGMEYFNTYGGNPVSCAVALSVLDVIEKEHLRDKATSVGRYLLEDLRQLQAKHSIIGDVRGIGLFIGIEIVKSRHTREQDTDTAAYILRKMKDRYIILSTDGPYANVIKFKPPMSFSEADAKLLVQELDATLSEINGKASDGLKAVNGERRIVGP